MPIDEEHYKRDEDRQWRTRVDGRLASLTSGETVQDDRLDELESSLEEVDILLRGSFEKESGGIIENLRDVQRNLNALRALMAPDALGAGGILNRLKALEKREERETRRSEYHWKFWIALVGFISATAVAVITNVDRIKGAFKEKPDRLEQMIENAKNPKPRYHHYVIREKPDAEE